MVPGDAAGTEVNFLTDFTLFRRYFFMKNIFKMVFHLQRFSL